MDFKTLLTDRRSIRDFQKKEVPLSLIKEILQDTCLSPTARNSQPCRFIIIQDQDVIKRMSDENKKNLLFDISQDPASPMKQLESRFRDDKFNVFYNAPCLVLFIGPVGAAFQRRRLRFDRCLFHVLRHFQRVGDLLDRLGYAHPQPQNAP